jgi:hypothetical protein
MKTRVGWSSFLLGCFLVFLSSPTQSVHAQFRPRNQCMIVSGSVLESTVSIVGGLPSRKLFPGQNCVETGHRGPGGLVYVDVDNPRIWTEVILDVVKTQWNGPMSQEVVADANASLGPGWQCFNCDLNVNETGGDAAPGGNELGGKAESIRETLLPWPGRSGHWGTPGMRQVTLLTEGLRVGGSRSRPLEVQLMIEGPDKSWQMAAFPLRVLLDPKVILIPVQILVLHADDGSPLVTSIDRQLALWDRFPTPRIYQTVVDSQFGEITSTTRELEDWVAGGEDGVSSANYVDEIYLPDDVFAVCGVQFRVVNFVQMAVDNRHLYPTVDSFPIDPQTALIENVDEFKQRPDFLPGVLTAVFTERCGYDTISDGGIGTGEGMAPPVLHDVACVNANMRNAILSHELGHVLLGSAHAPDNQTTNLMHSHPATATDLTAGQCTTVRNRATGFLRFWPPLPAPPPVHTP